MQRAQHEAVAAERHDHVGLFDRHFAIARTQIVQSSLRFLGPAGSKGDRRRFAHGSDSTRRQWQS
jgi:hypothetical protein